MMAQMMGASVALTEQPELMRIIEANIQVGRRSFCLCRASEPPTNGIGPFLP
jgi:hypothetical protein